MTGKPVISGSVCYDAIQKDTTMLCSSCRQELLTKHITVETLTDVLDDLVTTDNVDAILMVRTKLAHAKRQAAGQHCRALLEPDASQKAAAL